MFMDFKMFSYWVGRMVRVGRWGKVVVLLGKGCEEDYVGMF